MMIGRVPLALLALALVLVARPADAARPWVRNAAGTAGLVIAPKTSLVVDRVAMKLTCVDESGPRCRLDATYRLRNPSSAREETVAAFYGAASSLGYPVIRWPFDARLDGKDARRTLSADERATLDAAAVAAHAELAAYATTNQPSSYAPAGVTLVVDAGATRDLVLTAEIAPTEREIDGPWEGLIYTAIEARHPWLGTTYRYPVRELYEFFAPSGVAADVTVDMPGAWDVVKSSTADRTTLRVVLPGTRWLHGGPLAAVGLGIDRGGVRARVGYEVALPAPWTMESLAVETDFAGRTNIVPAFEIASPNAMIVMPSFGIGVGAPIQLRSNAATQVGVRAQLSIAFPCVSFVFPIDTYPAAPRAERFQAAALLQASF